MFVGHCAVGFIGKRIAPKVSLGTLVLAALLADLLMFVFIIAGIEHYRIRPGVNGFKAFDLYDYALSHSLLMGLIWGSLLAAAYFLWRRYRHQQNHMFEAGVLFVAVLSHWLLDFVAHNPDMPLAPGMDRYYGLGLWNSVPATIIVEGGFWLITIILYVRATRPVKRAGVYAFWPVIVLLTLTWINNVRIGPPPPSTVNSIISLVFFSLVVAWAYWMNRARSTRPSEQKQLDEISMGTHQRV